MLRFQPATRTVDGIPLEDAVDTLLRVGFHEHDRETDSAEMRKPGNRFLVSSGEKAPMRLSLARRGDGVDLVLRYGIFVAFDTGDLETSADRLTRALS